MNATVIDITGISVNVNTIHLEHSVDTANVIEIKDTFGNVATITICFGKITEVKSKVK